MQKLTGPISDWTTVANQIQDLIQLMPDFWKAHAKVNLRRLTERAQMSEREYWQFKMLVFSACTNGPIRDIRPFEPCDKMKFMLNETRYYGLTADGWNVLTSLVQPVLQTVIRQDEAQLLWDTMYQNDSGTLPRPELDRLVKLLDDACRQQPQEPLSVQSESSVHDPSETP